MLIGTPYSVQSASGVGSFVGGLSRMLRADGLSVSVVEPESPVLPHGVANLALGLKAARLLLRRRGEFDVVHCQQLHMQSLLLGLMARVLGKALLITVHGRSPRRSGLHGLAQGFIERASILVPEQLVYVAKSLRAELGTDGVIVPNGIDVEACRGSLAKRGQVRQKLAVGERFVILFVGRVTEDKGVFVLIDAFARVRSRIRRPLHLTIVGPVGEDVKDRLALMLGAFPDNAVAHGFQPDVAEFYAAADLFVLPSFREGLPLSMLEAMAAGVPVVASSVGDIPDVLLGGQAGILVPPGDAEALAAAILRMVEDAEQARRVARRASEVVAEAHDAHAMARRYRELYAQMLRSELSIRG